MITSAVTPFIEEVERKIGPLTNWAIVGNARTQSQPRDIDLIVIFSSAYDEAAWVALKRAWVKLSAAPLLDAAAATLSEIQAPHSVLSPLWFLQFQLTHQAVWQRSEKVKLPVLSDAGYYWALASRWVRENSTDEILSAFLATPEKSQAYPDKLSFLRAHAGQRASRREAWQGLMRALDTPLAEALTLEERLGWRKKWSEQDLDTCV